MKVKVRYFAILRDIAGVSEEEVEIDCGELRCLIERLRRIHGERLVQAIEYGIGNVKIAVLVNGEPKSKLMEGDEVAFLPPPSGGELRIGSKLDVLEEIRKFRQRAPPNAGSMVVYLGFVKGEVEGHKVISLKYETYEDYTRKRLKRIEDEIKARYGDLVDLKIIHVIDDLKPGDDVMLIMAMGKGRGDTLKAVQETVELVKHTTGIWKLESRDDGEFWVIAGNTRVRRDEEA